MSTPSNPTTPAKTAEPSDASRGYTRLHITPFDQDLVKIVIPSAILPNARNFSYHTIETFPEKRFGFVDLPEADAEKVKKRLNGAVLKGVKMRVDKARPQESYLPEPESEENGKKRKHKSKEKEERKKQKRDPNVVEGVVLHDRKVKRGWTVPEEAKIREKKSKKDKEKKDKKDKTKRREERSKYTDKEECLIKTKLPAKPTATKPADEDDNDDSERKKRQKKNKAREVVIHEFEKTTKFPTFLKATKPAPTEALTTEFVEGKGWVDAQGNVIESEKKRRTAGAPVPEDELPKKEKKKKVVKAPTPPPVDDDSTSSSGTSSEEDSSPEESSDEEESPLSPQKDSLAKTTKREPEASKPPPVEDDSTSSGGSSSEDSTSSDSDSDSDDEMEDAAKATAPAVPESPVTALKAADATRPRSSGSNVSLTIKIPPTTPAKVHPLEALYKRAKPDDNSTPGPDTEPEPFSFFGGGDNDDLEEEEEVAASTSQLPMTPFSKQDFEWRNVRSAAPTPDTAHPNHTKPFWAIGHDDEEDEEDEETREEVEATLNAERNAGVDAGELGGDFQDWFWKNRSNLNKSWMKRRKTAAKEKRHRDNKSRASKAV
ncbi:hypothetical protein Cob_v012272 [Colletotrichum orbiculare MAFF 240422]|uniref:Suppressor protein srp40 n=1 Tax=Colletotrichum orbiculare (strain 104-T / ATCC 96160 / CBS 514.97 / LARS 414 / MAFF 240422) TaxID=1213857 RepID=N4VJI4_COLOR|nr:hypothetical protein Cob_v012272 [Colletotrichum orbiculare MAFF 240422]